MERAWRRLGCHYGTDTGSVWGDLELEPNAAAFLTADGMGILVTLLGSVVPILKSRRMRLVEEIKAEHQFRICSEL